MLLMTNGNLDVSYVLMTAYLSDFENWSSSSSAIYFLRSRSLRVYDSISSLSLFTSRQRPFNGNNGDRLTPNS